MNKAELIDSVASATDMSKAEAEELWMLFLMEWLER